MRLSLLTISLSLLAGLLTSSAQAKTLYISSNNTVKGYDTVSGVVSTPITMPNGASAIYTAQTATGDLLVSDYFGDRVLRFSQSGTALGVFASTGMTGPHCVTVLQSGEVLVGNWGSGSGTTISRYSSAGSLLGNFTASGVNAPHGIAVGSDSNVYVANYADNSGTTVRRFSQAGADLGNFVSSPSIQGPQQIAFDSAGNLYSTSFALGTVRKYSPNGFDLGDFVTGLVNPSGVAVDDDGAVYIATYFEETVRKYNAVGQFQGVVASSAQGVSRPVGLLLASPVVVPEVSAFGLLVMAAPILLIVERAWKKGKSDE